jgi:CRISPR-associated protein Csm5
MKNFLKNYEFTLTVKGPVHIGDGKTLTKVDYFFYKDRIYFPNLHKMFLYIKQMHLTSDYESFMYSANNNLTYWLNDKRIISAVAEKCTDYSISLVGSSASKPRNLSTFVKDPYGNPYIPGSSLKGLIRTLLLAKEIVDNPDNYAEIESDIRSGIRNPRANKNNMLNRESSTLEEIAFHKLNCSDKRKNAVNDVFKGLIVSDSQPLSTNDLIVTEKIDYNVVGNEKPLPLYRESLVPNTQVKFNVTIDTSIFNYTIDDILQAVKLFAEDYYTYFSSNFRGIKKPTSNTVWLGGGAGYVSKTIMYNLFGDDAYNIVSSVLNVTAKQHHHDKDKKKGVSPVTVKLTKYNNTLCHYGECTLSIAEK